MARRAEGWKLKADRRTGIHYVRFTHAGRRYDESTRETDPVQAAAAAARLYAEIVSGRWVRRKVAPEAPRPGEPVDLLFAKWLSAIKTETDPDTWKMREIHARHLARFFGSLDRITTQSIADYRRARLHEVQRPTLVKELRSLTLFLEWCESEKLLLTVPTVELPHKSSVGVRSEMGAHREQAVELSPAEAWAIIDRLPDLTWDAKHQRDLPLHDYFVVLWETGLRPTTVGQLECPKHYRKGSASLTITDEVDKVRYGRLLDITDKARAALDRWAPEVGVIFGEHDFRVAFERAAAEASLAKELDPWKAERVTPYDFRHGRTTELVSAPGVSLAGVAYLLGHRQLTTTNRYAHPQRQAGREALEAAGKHSGGILGAGPGQSRPPGGNSGGGAS